MTLEEIKLISILLAGIGSVLAVVMTFIGLWVKNIHTRERELLGWAMQAALKDFEVQDNKKTISSHLYFHYHWLKGVDTGRATTDLIKQLTEEALKLNDASRSIEISNVPIQPTTITSVD